MAILAKNIRKDILGRCAGIHGTRNVSRSFAFFDCRNLTGWFFARRTMVPVYLEWDDGMGRLNPRII